MPVRTPPLLVGRGRGLAPVRVWLLATWALWRAGGRTSADEPYTWQETLLTWWAGMRGVATVALALALPFGFPGRDLILFTAFCVVLFTLLVQGLTLPLAVRLTGVSADTKAERRLERELWTRVGRAELARLKELAADEGIPDEIYERLHSRISDQLTRADPVAAEEDQRAVREAYERFRRFRDIQEAVTAAGRQEALSARSEPGMPPEIVDRVMRRLDLHSART